MNTAGLDIVEIILLFGMGLGIAMIFSVSLYRFFAKMSKKKPAKWLEKEVEYKTRELATRKKSLDDKPKEKPTLRKPDNLVTRNVPGKSTKISIKNTEVIMQDYRSDIKTGRNQCLVHGKFYQLQPWYYNDAPFRLISDSYKAFVYVLIMPLKEGMSCDRYIGYKNFKTKGNWEDYLGSSGQVDDWVGVFGAECINRVIISLHKSGKEAHDEEQNLIKKYGAESGKRFFNGGYHTVDSFAVPGNKRHSLGGY